MNKYPDIIITKKDLIKIVYFILMKFKSDSLHRQGTSSKRDLIGGYIERWFNKVAETIIFDTLLKDKKYRVISDYFIYDNESDKNAPDILGLRNDNEIIPFTEYNNDTWVRVNLMPKIEVKVVRNDQQLLGIREPQMNDDYYVFIESDLEGDYLTALFEDDIFNQQVFDELKMNNVFIKNDRARRIIEPVPVQKTSHIGTMRLIGIYTKEELLKYSVLCKKKVSPYYFDRVENKDFRSPNCNEELILGEGNMYVYKFDESYIALPISIENPEKGKLTIKKKNKGSLYLNSTTKLIVNGTHVEKGSIAIYYKKFDRSSNWDENIVSKHILETYGQDSTLNLLSIFDELISRKESLS